MVGALVGGQALLEDVVDPLLLTPLQVPVCPFGLPPTPPLEGH